MRGPKPGPEGGVRVPPALPAALRKHQRFLITELRKVSTETHTLHRLWYKNQAQLRHMTWWRRVRPVRQLGCRIATGPLRGSVPRAGSMGSSRGDATESAYVALDDDVQVLGTELLLALAQAYTSLWGEEASTWESLPRFSTPPTHAVKKGPFVRALRRARALKEAVEELERRCRACFVAIEEHLNTPPAPMHAAISMTLMSICAHLAAVAHAMLQGDGNESLARLCSLLASPNKVER
ncbi:uncharacterized protein MJAP1_000570 [Malassezia japonica]|uniref:Uncharacterized protein n=1 Tax=Malassezia japonica TaxID=223818 RepID=A0AAF0EUZ2_9BASI|nr:uncharacterized protein MJAP1_000570 [Malassezia japonica]WFD37623.1 hypothetical protein MJAP1_000570 [Malassezia japonica]